MSVFLDFEPCLMRYTGGRFYVVEGPERGQIVEGTAKKGYRDHKNAQASMMLINERRFQQAMREFYDQVDGAKSGFVSG